MDPQTLTTVGTGAVLLAAIIGALTYARQSSRDLRIDLKTDINQARVELKADINQIRTDLKTDINQARNDLKQDMETRHAELRADIVALRANLPSPVYLEPAAPRAPQGRGKRRAPDKTAATGRK